METRLSSRPAREMQIKTIMGYHHVCSGVAKKELMATRADKEPETPDRLCGAGGNVRWGSHSGDGSGSFSES